MYHFCKAYTFYLHGSENLEPADRMKYEIAEELGLLEKVRKGGWKALSSRETGQIGGMVSRRKKALEKEQKTK